MISRNALELYLDHYLDCQSFKDYAPNGLQIEGRSEIKRLCTAVSISQAVISAANAWQADAILVHHGMFWPSEPLVIKDIRRQRIAALLKHDLNLFAYHLPLDAHVKLGNNACIASRLALNEISQHDLKNMPKGLWTGYLDEFQTAEQLALTLNTVFHQKPIHIAAEKQIIKKIAWCSGAAQNFIHQAAELNADAYISGEVSERTYDEAKELNIHYYGCGHHATERYGVQALGEHLQNLYGLAHLFIDSDNPI